MSPCQETPMRRLSRGARRLGARPTPSAHWLPAGRAGAEQAMGQRPLSSKVTLLWLGAGSQGASGPWAREGKGSTGTGSAQATGQTHSRTRSALSWVLAASPAKSTLPSSESGARKDQPESQIQFAPGCGPGLGGVGKGRHRRGLFPGRGQWPLAQQRA